ncbi:sugar transferase [Halobacillus halophilus]|uniref:TuaA n=1 Tax=Halobacillus halophilus (strain ATCC 35676 / DSM 2266 / JCM 20832 / KCTC 3685 / LMG 17431 / NBRC 102448 / NCIMB 2269) TaxID=866895 RepID=I0JRK2_HALH3|nr:sugar transferase [Halobacillus halophilus]ASF40746.1 sugar transferase [Halobacillus halophilus]CCG46773.1 TuaA [Halobacillus halophilus DSM 2266]
MIIKEKSSANERDYVLRVERSFYENHINYKVLIYNQIKSVIDVFIAIIGLVVTSPILILAAVAIKIESKGSVFYLQERVGLHGKIFKVIKLRSMAMGAEKNGAQWAATDDPRVTKVGKALRKTRIDEIPQFINMLKGDMSLIGPRPERPVFTALFNEETPGFVNRLSIKPGLTGWAQVNGGYDITPPEKLKLDIEYIKSMNLTLDIKIILLTIKIVFTGNGAR